MEKLENGQNENCRVYGVEEHKCASFRSKHLDLWLEPSFYRARLTPLDTRGTLTAGNVEDYQVGFQHLPSEYSQTNTDLESHRTIPRWHTRSRRRWPRRTSSPL